MVSPRRYWQTVRRLTARQVLWRLRLLAQRRWYALAGGSVTRRLARQATRAGTALATQALLPGADALEATPAPPDLAACLARAAAVQAGRFTFLAETRHLAGAELWRCPGASRLWRYHLHYFDYAVDLGVAYRSGEAAAYACFRDLVTSWLDHNPVGAPDAWHPYPLSLRVVNWLNAARLFAPALADDPPFTAALAVALGAQVRFLRRNLEYDVRGNHLVKNALALCVAGAALADPLAGQWARLGRAILEREAPEQVLADGGHCERSPMYHGQVLLDFLQAVAVLRATGAPAARNTAAAARRMLGFLAAVRQPDGEIPLFNDASLGVVPPPDVLLAVGAAVLDGTAAGPDSVWRRLLAPASTGTPPQPDAAVAPVVTALPDAAPAPQSAHLPDVAPAPVIAALPHTGYWVFRPPGEYLAVDCGPPCPPYLPAHAHCDLLSFEYAAGGQRIVVDAGTYTYAAGPWRQWFRSTAAHNTLVINGREQHDAWGAFRLGERSALLAVASGEAPGLAWFTGAYRLPRRGPVHRRLVAWIAGAGWVIADLVEAAGALSAESWLHLHPAVAARAADAAGAAPGGIAPGDPAPGDPAPGGLAPGGALLLTAGAVRLQALPLVGLRWEILPGGQAEPPALWYSERFGERTAAPALRLRAGGAGRLRLASALLTNAGAAALAWQDNLLTLTLPGRTYRLRWEEGGARLL